MSSAHIWFFKSCWSLVLQNSLLIRSSDVVVYLNPSRDVIRRETGKKLLRETFQNQTVTIHERGGKSHQEGAKAALVDAMKEEWFKDYDWVI